MIEDINDMVYSVFLGPDEERVKFLKLRLLNNTSIDRKHLLLHIEKNIKYLLYSVKQKSFVDKVVKGNIEKVGIDYFVNIVKEDFPKEEAFLIPGHVYSGVLKQDVYGVANEDLFFCFENEHGSALLMAKYFGFVRFEDFECLEDVTSNEQKDILFISYT